MSVSVMKKLTVLSFQKDSRALLRRLLELRCVEVRQTNELREALSLGREEAQAEIEACDAVLKLLREAIPLLRSYDVEQRENGLREYSKRVFEQEGHRALALKTAESAIALKRRLDELRAKPAEIKTEMLALEPWLELDQSPADAETKTTETCYGVLRKPHDPEILADRAAELGAIAETVSVGKGNAYLSVTFFKDRREEWEALASEFEFLRVELPRKKGTPQQCYAELEARLARCEDDVLEMETEMIGLAENLDKLEILCDLTATDRSLAELHERLANTDSCSVLEGWVPLEMQEPVEEALGKFECAFELREPLENEDPPVLLKNNRFAKNFEWVVGMYSYPQYGRFDPTMIMSVFYFIIFGLMFADVGYGLLLALGGFCGARFLRLKPGMQRSFCMFGYCGLSAMLMGVLFGGWFGDLPTALMENVLGISVDTAAGRFFGSGLLFNPVEDPLSFMIFSIALGGVHLVAGMAVNLYIQCRDGKVMEGICTTVPFWVLFLGLVLLVVNTTAGLIVAALGAFLILVLNGYGIRNPFKRLLKGLGGWYGLINYASDLLSYSRILALGLVAAVIAKVVNMITMMGDQGVIGPVVMVVVLVVGHVVNLAINVLGSFVHTARLQYMEFFGKFYEDGGRPFEPAVPSEEYSESMDEKNI